MILVSLARWKRTSPMVALLSFVAVIAVNATEPPLIPAFFTGERLLEICTHEEAAWCSMYVIGVVDGIFRAETGRERSLCRGDLNNRDARKIVTAYLQERAEARSLAAAAAVELALSPVIGCDVEARPDGPE